MEANQDLSSSLRVASFSCYLNNPEESFVQKIWAGSSNNLKISSKPHHTGLGVNNVNNFSFNVASSKPVRDPTVAFILPHQHNIIKKPTCNNNPKKKKFINTTTSNNYATVPGGIKYTNDLQGQKGHFKSATTTPSVCSSESSSQMALLPNIIKQHNTKKGNIIGRKLFLGFGCRGPCSDKKAVFLSQANSDRTFLGQAKGITMENNIGGGVEDARKSLEVFGGDKNGGVAGNMERKLSMLTWDAIPNTNNTKPQNNNKATIICDDNNPRASDASSDLFEIEDISSCNGYGYVASSQTAVDYTSVCSSPTTQYEPSEASIQWSVVTASVADYVSDYCGEDSAKATKTAAVKSGHNKSRSGGGLLGCNSHKAVSVAETLPKPAQGNHPHAHLSFARNV